MVRRIGYVTTYEVSNISTWTKTDYKLGNWGAGSLEKLSVGRTVIAIAHRLSTIVRADKVVVLEQGRIVEEGGYQELLEQQGKLWKYHQMQHELGQVG
jgi:ABC-type transport system involved in Fe-S cluster assembly fused permease/ATPase subunit